VIRPGVGEQQVLIWPTAIPGRASSPDIVAYLRRTGVRVQEGDNAFYLPPQPGLALALGAVVDRYPPGSGFKILRDFRSLDEAHYLHPRRQTRLRRRLIGTPREQLIAANYLHRLGLGPRVWDVCLLRAGGVPMPAFVVHHVEGTTPDAEECAAFMQRVRTALAETELRISVPNWERTKDFRCPTCNHNLLRDTTGSLTYIDFQNFTVRDPRRIAGSTVDGTTTPWSSGRRCGFRRAGAPAGRFDAIRRLLRSHGVDLHHRVVLDVGCGSGTMLHQALAAGAWWALGWDRPAVVLRAQAIAVALGFTRLDITQADPSDRYDLGSSIPTWLGRYLEESVVFVPAARRPDGLPRSLIDLPWRALVYEARRGEAPDESSGHIHALLRRGVRLAHPISSCPAGPGEQPLHLLIRDPTAVSAAPALHP
jgi:SAM-dependent methyltransferase